MSKGTCNRRTRRGVALASSSSCSRPPSSHKRAARLDSAPSRTASAPWPAIAPRSLRRSGATTAGSSGRGASRLVRARRDAAPAAEGAAEGGGAAAGGASGDSLDAATIAPPISSTSGEMAARRAEPPPAATHLSTLRGMLSGIIESDPWPLFVSSNTTGPSESSSDSSSSDSAAPPPPAASPRQLPAAFGAFFVLPMGSAQLETRRRGSTGATWPSTSSRCSRWTACSHAFARSLASAPVGGADDERMRRSEMASSSVTHPTRGYRWRCGSSGRWR